MRAVILVSVIVLICATSNARGKGRVPEIEGHRGESHDAPENTMASFNLAWQRDDDAAELDVHLTRDGKLIVSHDPDTHRLADTKLVIKDTPAEELRKLDVGKWKGPQFAGEKLPMLDEVLATIPPGKRLFIEVKVGPEAVPELVRCLERAAKSPAQTVIIAFDINTVREAKKQLPKLKVYWLADLKQDKQTKAWGPGVQELIAKAKGAGVDGIDVSAKEPVNAAFVKAVHDAGLECYVWTVDDPARARDLANAGVDGITTNRAAWLREQLQQ
jgi:glycerophosphoryl diester phosphodiesterase